MEKPTECINMVGCRLLEVIKARRVPGEEAQTWRSASISADFTGGFQ
jgi:hypothetical protein